MVGLKAEETVRFQTACSRETCSSLAPQPYLDAWTVLLALCVGAEVCLRYARHYPFVGPGVMMAWCRMRAPM